jgi:MoxR-like ATPase
MSIKFGRSVSLNEFANMIATVGSDVTVIGQGEPGIGKSSMLKVLAKRFPDYELAYIDCTLLDLGDFALPYTEVVNMNTVNVNGKPELMGGLKVTKFAPNARFKFQSGKPVIVMLDEIGKAMKAVKNLLMGWAIRSRHTLGIVYVL